ncbi:ABATE domain-containing protein [Streptomyces mirabilis]|uniref:ABATE domain-containing protein n=1 Tax=Streptomyces mirabilis TaxID=68239 RepID=UPI00339E8682
MPPGPVPDAAAVRRLRAAVRDVLDSHQEGRSARPTSADDIYAAAAAAPVSPRLVVTADGIQRRGTLAHRTRWERCVGRHRRGGHRAPRRQ